MAEAERFAKTTYSLFLAEHLASQASGVRKLMRIWPCSSAAPPLRATAGASAGAPAADRARLGYLQQTGQADQAWSCWRHGRQSASRRLDQLHTLARCSGGEYDPLRLAAGVIRPTPLAAHEEESLRVTNRSVVEQGRFRPGRVLGRLGTAGAGESNGYAMY